MAKRQSTAPKLHPTVLTKNGRKEFVVLPYEEFVLIQQQLEDARDLMELRRAVLENDDSPSLSLDEVKARLGLSGRRNGGRRARKKVSG